MIITEIKQLNVRISEFEDPIFDNNILPVFTTPLILKEVDARKKSKYKIETLNPNKKLTFRIVSFNEIVEQLAARINKIAIDLEPHYFIDPSYSNSLPYNVREFLNKKNLIDETKEIKEAVLRVKRSTVKGKKLILYARPVTLKRFRRRNRRTFANLLRNKGRASIPALTAKASPARVIREEWPVRPTWASKGWSGDNVNPLIRKPLFINKDIFKNRSEAIINFKNFEILRAWSGVCQQTALRKRKKVARLIRNIININKLLPLLLSGWIPTSKGALMLLEDQGWDLDLLSNKNSRSLRLKKRRPFRLRKLRRFRRLRRLRLMSINLYLHRSKNMEIIQKDQLCQGRNHSKLNKVVAARPNEATAPNIAVAIALKNKHLIKHNNNKLNFIINWIGDNLALNYLNPFFPNPLGHVILQTGTQTMSTSLLIRQEYASRRVAGYSWLNTTLPILLENQEEETRLTQRLSKKNISDIFLSQHSKPIQLLSASSLEVAAQGQSHNNTTGLRKPAQGNTSQSLGGEYKAHCASATQPLHKRSSISTAQRRQSPASQNIPSQPYGALTPALGSSPIRERGRAGSKTIPPFTLTQYLKSRFDSPEAQRRLAVIESQAGVGAAYSSPGVSQQHTLSTPAMPELRTAYGRDGAAGTNLSVKNSDLRNWRKPLQKWATNPNTNSGNNAKKRKFVTLASSILTISSIAEPATPCIVSHRLRPCSGGAAASLSPALPRVDTKVLIQHRAASSVAGSAPNSEKLSINKKTSKPKKGVLKTLPQNKIKTKIPNTATMAPTPVRGSAGIVNTRGAEAHPAVRQHLSAQKGPLQSTLRATLLNTLTDRPGKELKPWNKIASLLNLGGGLPALPQAGLPLAVSAGQAGRQNVTTTKPGLFWAIIKLYSSSFNPMFKSLNNKYLTLPGLSGLSTALPPRPVQGVGLKVLKNSQEPTMAGHTPAAAGIALKASGMGAVSPQQNTLKSLPPHIVNLLLSHFNSELNAISLPNFSKAKTAKAKRRQEVIYATQLSRIAKLKEYIQALSVVGKARRPKTKQGKIEGSVAQQRVTPRTLRRTPNPLNFNLFDPLIKKKVINFLHAGRTAVPPTAETDSTASAGWRRPAWYTPASPTLGGLDLSLPPVREIESVNKSYINSNYLSRSTDRLADNKRFLFLYFIVPIFFATLKKSIAAPNGRQRNLNNQKKQLGSLIKLMLTSGSPVRVAGIRRPTLLASSAHTSLRRGAVEYTGQASPKSALLRKRIDAKDINYLIESMNLNTFITNKKNNSPLRKVKANNLDSARVVILASELLKWSILIIAKSLAPLKRKHEYYSLIFSKILETRGFLALNNKANVHSKEEPALTGLPYAGPAALPYVRAGKGGGSVGGVAEATQPKEKNLTTANVDNTKKQATITFYPGGRFISDWKRVTKVIWQEEYKFNAVYLRVKNSLNLANNNINKNLRIWYTFLTIFRFWDAIKITSVKSISSFKLQVLFLKYGIATRLIYIKQGCQAIGLAVADRECSHKHPALTGALANLSRPALSKEKGGLAYAGCSSVASAHLGLRKNSWLSVRIIRDYLMFGRRTQTTPALFPTKYSRADYKTYNILGDTTESSLRISPAFKKDIQVGISRPAQGKPGRGWLAKKNAMLKKAKTYAKLNKKDIIRRTVEFFNASAPGLPVREAGRQVDFLDKLKYPIIESFLKVLNKIPVATPKKWTLGVDPMQASLTKKFYSGFQTASAYATANKQNIKGRQTPLTFFENLLLWVKLKNNVLKRNVITTTSLSINLNQYVKYMKWRITLIFSIHRLVLFKKLGFISKSVIRTLAPASLAWPLTLYKGKSGSGWQARPASPVQPTRAAAIAYVNIPEQIVEQAIGNLNLNTEFKKSFNNLVNAKSTIIGKIRSIKLVELIDKMKEEIIIAEQLAALVRVADITDLNLINKKKFRRINASKYLNKKNIYRSNRIKILQTIETIKTDLRFEPKLDSNSLSQIPVSLLYYSNLKPTLALPNNPTPYGTALTAKATPARGGAGSLTRALVNTEVEKPPVISAYLRELSIYNREIKGTMNYFSKIVGYNFNTNTNKISSSIYNLLAASFKTMRCLISKPVFVITPEKITIQLFYFLLVAGRTRIKRVKRKLRSRYFYNKDRLRQIYKKSRLRQAKKYNLSSLNKLFPEQFELLCASLNKVFNKPVELNLIRLHYPSEDSNILVNLMGLIIHKIRLYHIFRKIFGGSIIKSLIKLKAQKFNDITVIPAFLTGLSIKVAGRLMTQPLRPRKTINQTRRGASASGKINYLNFARITKKNKRGSFSITISAGQNYFK